MPGKELRTEPAFTGVAVVDEHGKVTTNVHVGGAFAVRGNGLRPDTHYKVTLEDEGGEILTSSVMSDRRGQVQDTVVWAQIGLDDPRSERQLPVAETMKRWMGKSIRVRLKDLKNKAVGETEARVDKDARPMAMATDKNGSLLNGFEIGRSDAMLTLANFPKGRHLRIWMAPRQHDWRVGDQIRPAVFARKRRPHVDVVTDGTAQTVVVAKRAELMPGAYDFVIRDIRYGYDDDDHLVIRDTDVITNRLSTGLVVREGFMASKVIKGGCTNLQQIACRRTLGNVWPYVQFTDVFQVGEDVWGTLDPNALDPAHTGKAAAIYIVPHKTAAQWTADNSLNHLAVLGGNAATQKWVTQSWCANANLHLLWSNATQVGDYDVVVDFGNNSPTLAGFTQDDHYNMPLDMIDGYIVPGFKIVPDPAVDTSFNLPARIPIRIRR